MGTNYEPNSHKYKEEQNKQPETEKKVEKVITGTAKPRKKTELRKLADVFISDDVHNVKSYILMDVLIPSVKKATSDIVRNGIDMILYGGSSSPNKSSSPSSKISYKSFYDSKSYDNRDSYKARSGYDFSDIILDNRGEAEDVISRMDELVSTYGQVTVADFYDLVGITGNYTDNRYGWTNIRSASVERVRDGYLIKLPKASALN
jgi:hypothetical protein